LLPFPQETKPIEEPQKSLNSPKRKGKKGGGSEALM
jgi:hypothetical protein